MLKNFLEYNSANPDAVVRLFCVHPSASKLLGVPAFPSLTAAHIAAGGTLDLFVCGVAASSAHGMIVEA